MSQIDLNTAHIADVNIKDFADFSNLGGDQKAVIKVNRNTFNVSVSAGGDVSVSFKGGLFNIFRGKTKSRLLDQIKAQVDGWKAATAKPDENALKDTIAASTDKALGKAFGAAPGMDAVDGQGAEVAVYGFSNIRQDNYDSAMSHNIKYSMVDDYNRYIGISPRAITAHSINNVIKDLQDNPDQVFDKSTDIPRENLLEWRHFLGRPENIKKIDILGRIREYIEIGVNPTRADKKLTGWKGEFARSGAEKGLQAFVRKNIPGDSKMIEVYDDDNAKVNVSITDAHIAVLADALYFLVTQDVENITTPLVNGCLVEAAKENGMQLSQTEMQALNEVVDSIIGNAFFRQTSKLGLDFFREKGIPVMFYWTNHQGYSMPDENPALGKKWWKDLNASIQDHYGAAITFSEMRHVQKMLRTESEGGQPFIFAKIMGQKV